MYDHVHPDVKHDVPVSSAAERLGSAQDNSWVTKSQTLQEGVALSQGHSLPPDPCLQMAHAPPGPKCPQGQSDLANPNPRLTQLPSGLEKTAKPLMSHVRELYKVFARSIQVQFRGNLVWYKLHLLMLNDFFILMAGHYLFCQESFGPSK